MFGLKLYNLMSGAGFSGGAYSSDWIMAWVGLFLIVVLLLLTKKWLGEEQMLGPFSFLGAFLGPLAYFIVISLSGSFKIALVGGLIGITVGGYIGGRFENG